MLKSALFVAIPALGLGIALAQSSPTQWRSLASAIGGVAGVSRQDALPASSAHSTRRDLSAAGTAAIDANGNGQFETIMDVGGRSYPVLVDTGATLVALTYDDAASIGLHPRDADFHYTVTTANGVARAAVATVPSIRVGNVEADNVPVVIAMPGTLTGRSLLGMSFLSKLSGFQVQSNRLILRQ